jgi:hypothetical protein
MQQAGCGLVNRSVVQQRLKHDASGKSVGRKLQFGSRRPEAGLFQIANALNTKGA